MVYNSVGEIYDDIEKMRNAIYKRVSALTEDEQNFRPDENSWSVAQIVEHLAKTEAGIIPLFFKLLKKSEAENLVSDGNLNPPVSFASQAAKVANIKIEAPEMIRPEGNATLAESLAKLEESRKTILDLRPRFEAANHSETVFPHRILGDINLYEWLAFIGLHESRHLAQIERILAKPEHPEDN